MLICIFDYLTTLESLICKYSFALLSAFFPPTEFSTACSAASHLALQIAIYSTQNLLGNDGIHFLCFWSCWWCVFCLFLGLIPYFIFSSQEIFSLHWIRCEDFLESFKWQNIFRKITAWRKKQRSAVGSHWYYALSLEGLDTGSLKELNSSRLSLIIRVLEIRLILKVQEQNCERNPILYRRDCLSTLWSPERKFLTIHPLIKRIHLTSFICWRNMRLYILRFWLWS